MYGGRENAYEGEESEGHHHHHHHHHHEREESEEYQRQPPYGSEFEPRRGYPQEELVAPAPYGYRPPVHEYGGGPNEEGGPYGTVLHQNSPYAHAPPPPAPAPVHRGGEEQQRHHRVDIPGRLVRIFCKANPNFHVSVRPGKGVVMAPFNPHDEYQVWVKEESMGTRVKDSTGSPAFALVNKATGQALRHAPADLEQVLLADFQLGVQDESLLWSQSEDMGEGYHCIRMVNKITSNLDALQGDKKSGGVKDGTPVILFAWKKQENQVWKIIPAWDWKTKEPTRGELCDDDGCQLIDWVLLVASYPGEPHHHQVIPDQHTSPNFLQRCRSGDPSPLQLVHQRYLTRSDESQTPSEVRGGAHLSVLICCWQYPRHRMLDPGAQKMTMMI